MFVLNSHTPQTFLLLESISAFSLNVLLVPTETGMFLLWPSASSASYAWLY